MLETLFESLAAFLEEKTMEFRVDFIEYLTEGVLVLNEQNLIVTVNSALEKLLEQPAEFLTGKSCTEVINCQLPGQSVCHEACPLLNLKPGLKEEPLTFFSRSGLRREVRASFTELAPGYGMLILQDISAQKRQERLQVEFISTASHQLRTPLASIKTSIGLLLDNVGPDFQPLLRRLLGNIQVSSLRLERVVNDLIELTSLLSGRVQLLPRQLEIHQLVEQAIKFSQPWLAGRSQSLELDLPDETIFVEADSTRLVQVLGHLLSNACKFSPAGSLIRLAVSQAKPRVGPDKVIFSVIDQGIGLDPQEKEFIFEKFYQVQSVENSSGAGSGLGLPLAKALIELSGGEIWCESEPGKGSTFSFSLPLAWISPATMSATSEGRLKI